MKKPDIPKVVSMRVFFCVTSYGEFRVSPVDMSEYWTVLGERTITVDVPDDLPDAEQTERKRLRDKRKKIMADAQEEVNQIDQQIAGLSKPDKTLDDIVKAGGSRE